VSGVALTLEGEGGRLERDVPSKVVANLQTRQTIGSSSGRSSSAWHSAQKGTAPPEAMVCGWRVGS